MLVLWIICALLTGAIASGKGKSFGAWCAIGFLIGVLGPVVAAFMKEEKGDSNEEYERFYTC